MSTERAVPGMSADRTGENSRRSASSVPARGSPALVERPPDLCQRSSSAVIGSPVEARRVSALTAHGNCNRKASEAGELVARSFRGIPNHSWIDSTRAASLCSAADPLVREANRGASSKLGKGGAIQQMQSERYSARMTATTTAAALAYKCPACDPKASTCRAIPHERAGCDATQSSREGDGGRRSSAERRIQPQDQSGGRECQCTRAYEGRWRPLFVVPGRLRAAMVIVADRARRAIPSRARVVDTDREAPTTWCSAGWDRADRGPAPSEESQFRYSGKTELTCIPSTPAEVTDTSSEGPEKMPSVQFEPTRVRLTARAGADR